MVPTTWAEETPSPPADGWPRDVAPRDPGNYEPVGDEEWNALVGQSGKSPDASRERVDLADADLPYAFPPETAPDVPGGPMDREPPVADWEIQEARSAGQGLLEHYRAQREQSTPSAPIPPQPDA